MTNKNIQFILFFTIIVVSIILMFLLLNNLWNKQRPPIEQFLVEIPGQHPLRIIHIEELTSDTNLVKNFVDGYQITLPAHWEIRELASVTLGLNAYLTHSENGELEEHGAHGDESGISLTIKKFSNKNKLSLADWLTAVKNQELDDVIFHEAIEGHLDDLSFVETSHANPKIEGVEAAGMVLQVHGTYMEDSKSVYYVLKNNDRRTEKNIYVLICYIMGQEFLQNTECEEAVQTFEILN